jgi:hypothetical protein
MINIRHAQVLQILADNPQGLKTGQIVRIADDNPKSQIVDVSDCSEIVYRCRLAGNITTWKDGKSNAHKITKAGLDVLKEYNEANGIESTPAEGGATMEVETDNREESDRSNNELLETAGDDKALVLDTVQKQEPEIEAAMDLEESIQPIHADEVAEGLEFHDMITSFGAGVNAFIAGTKQLIAELDEAKAEIERLRALQAISNKRETIAVLKHVQGFVKPINADFDVVLGDIVQKIEAMPEAA